MKRRDDRDEEVKPIARQIEQLARAPLYAPRGYRTGDYGNHTERQLLFRVSVVASAVPCAHATIVGQHPPATRFAAQLESEGKSAVHRHGVS